jgi:integrase
MAAYHEALEQPRVQIGTSRSKPGTVAAAVAAYLLSPQFAELAQGTQAARRSVLQRFRNGHGEKPIGAMPPKFIALMLSTMKPHVARNYFKTIRALCQFAVSVEMIAFDPTQGIKRPKAKTEHRRPWTDAEVAQFERVHPIGSKARLGFALGLYTVQRLGDVIRMGRQHIHNGELTVRQNKTGTSLVLPVLPELQAIIDATPGEHLTFLVKNSGRPYCGTEFSGQFRAWCDEAGLPKGCTFHGLRATGCTRRADAGCSAHEIAAWSGHMTLKEVERYTKSANQKRLAVQAMARIANK